MNASADGGMDTDCGAPERATANNIATDAMSVLHSLAYDFRNTEHAAVY